MTDVLLGYVNNGENDVITPNLEAQQPYLLGNPNLPIANHRAEIEHSLLNDTVLVIEATTGSGKSTQVVQYIHELHQNNLLDVETVILTQPRILPARALCGRITDEMQQAGVANPKVGYYTQPEGSEVPQHMQDIAVLTEGKAAMQLLHRRDHNPDKLRYLVIDEVHEFGKFTELLLAIAHQKTDPNSLTYDPNLRAVVMSATLDAARMKRYFNHTKTGLVQVHVPTYPVERSESADDIAKTTLRLSQAGSTVLAFHAGKGEIKSTQSSIDKIQAANDKDTRVAVVPLHAQQNAEQQKLAFEKYDNGLVVLTTNVAETSVTVPDAVAVVDTGEVRTSATAYDLVPTGHNTLDLQDASQASINQRAGRVGRTAPGQYVLVTQTGPGMPLTFKARPKYPIPSIQRESLDDLVLFTKAINQNMSDFEFFHEPEQQAIQAAAQKLFMLGAIDSSGNITDRGRHMDTLPLNPEYACMVVYAQEQGYSDDVKQSVLDIVAIMQRNGIFKRSPKEQRWKQLLQQNEEGDVAEQDSDLFAQLEGYVELIDHIHPDDWEDYDVDVHAVELIAQRRQSLARAVGLSDQGPACVVDPKNRATVLACIHAGQLPQLWRRNGEQLQLLMGPNVDFDTHPSTVVGDMGRIVTGSLFSLGMRGEYRHSVQDISRVLDPSSLDKIAGHLIKELEVPGSAVYSPERQALVVDVQRKLGPLVISTVKKEIDTTTNQARVGELINAHADQAWRDFVNTKRQTKIPVRLQGDIDPLSEVIGNNPLTNEPINAWRGADKWVRTKEDAIKSLEAAQKRLQGKPAFEQRQHVKQQIAKVRRSLIEVSKNKGDRALANQAKALLRQKDNTPERLQRIYDFLAVVTT